ncbi:MAG: TIM barrel protein [Christensenellaceae bacterium]|jgi:deoxyribonuclease-4|nr:TIM barrel protein [Christensenellaceae bacterium]
MIKFGFSGHADRQEGYTLPEFVEACVDMDIDLYEYPFGRGITTTILSNTPKIKSAFENTNILLSVHAPYFTNFANPDFNMVENSIGYVLNAIQCATIMNAQRIIVHPATQGKVTRCEAMKTTKYNLLKLCDKLDQYNINDCQIHLETMGKHGQLGTSEEILEMCSLDRRFYPCVDFGHLNARELGHYTKNPEAFEMLLTHYRDSLPAYKMSQLHIHFSKIQYGNKGELKHLTFSDTFFGPDFEPLIDALIKHNLNAHIICESAGTQDVDALTMKKYFLRKTSNI